MARFVAILVAALALALGACGGDDGDSKSGKATNGAPAAGGSKRRPSSPRETVPAPKPGTPRLTGQRQVAYLKAKAACDSGGVKGIARRYGLRERNAVIVARLYSEKAFAEPDRGAGFAGCVAGFR